MSDEWTADDYAAVERAVGVDLFGGPSVIDYVEPPPAPERYITEPIRSEQHSDCGWYTVRTYAVQRGDIVRYVHARTPVFFEAERDGLVDLVAYACRWPRPQPGLRQIGHIYF